MLLDSTILIDFLKNQPEAIQKISELEKKSELLSTATICVFEVMVGIRKNTDKQRERATSKMFKRFTVLSFDFDAAIEASQIYQNLSKKGAPVDAEDCMIAGIAKIYNETVLTRNTKHFSRIKEIKIESY